MGQEDLGAVSPHFTRRASRQLRSSALAGLGGHRLPSAELVFASVRSQDSALVNRNKDMKHESDARDTFVTTWLSEDSKLEPTGTALSQVAKLLLALVGILAPHLTLSPFGCAEDWKDGLFWRVLSFCSILFPEPRVKNELVEHVRWRSPSASSSPACWRAPTPGSSAPISVTSLALCWRRALEKHETA